MAGGGGVVSVCVPEVLHRSTGWKHWRGWCPEHRQGTPWGNRGDAEDWVLDHLQDNPITECACWPVIGLRTEYSPDDCPLHKEPQK